VRVLESVFEYLVTTSHFILSLLNLHTNVFLVCYCPFNANLLKIAFFQPSGSYEQLEAMAKPSREITWDRPQEDLLRRNLLVRAEDAEDRSLKPQDIL